MTTLSRHAGLSTIVTHYQEGDNPLHAHITPIYQNSTFSFPDAETAGKVFAGEQEGYIYSRGGHPNATQLAQKIAYLEGLDLIRREKERQAEDIVFGRVTASGMAAISMAILTRVQNGDTVITQRHLYGNSYRFFNEIAPRLGIRTVWVDDISPAGWQAAFKAHPQARLAYVETPANPTMTIIDLAAVAEIAHAHDAWVMADNTFATPYHQRPLSLGCDVVVHSTTKYLTGHGLLIGGAIVGTDRHYMTDGKEGVAMLMRVMGPAPSPFDCWLGNIGLKTFELRMARHAASAQRIAQWLDEQPQVARVHYPGLPGHPQHELAQSQMHNGFGGMISFELAGGYEAGVSLMDHVRLATLAVSLGNVDTLIEHPASMTHAAVPAAERRKTGLSDGLVRLSVGIENVDDLIADLAQALRAT